MLKPPRLRGADAAEHRHVGGKPRERELHPGYLGAGIFGADGIAVAMVFELLKIGSSICTALVPEFKFALVFNVVGCYVGG